MRHVGLVAALPGELRPLVRGWQRAGQVYLGDLAPAGAGEQPTRVYAVAAGMGSAAASRGFAQVVVAAASAGQRLDAVVSYGWAGAISCGVKPPEVCSVAEVVESRTGERFVTANPPPEGGAPLRLLTIDHIARPGEKRGLAERYKAVLVDMEAATVARLAQAHGLPFFCVKGVSDGYTDALPDFNRFLDRQGQLVLARLLLHVLPRPWQWRALARLGVQSRAAATGLHLRLRSCLAETTLVS